MKNKIKLILAIRNLDIGGAERQFIELVKKIDHNNFDVKIISNYRGHLDHELVTFEHILFNKSSRWDLFYFLKLAKYLNNHEPDVVYSFMPDMNVTMAIARILSFKKFKLIWGQFGTAPDFKAYHKLRERVFLIQRKLEFISDALISDSNGGLEFYRNSKYNLKNSRVIFSGSDLDRFTRNIYKRMEFRTKHNIKEGDIAIGICSRLDPMKGYAVLAEAARNILQQHSNVFFFSIGYGDETILSQCNEILGEFSERFVWLGKKVDPENFMSGWDIYCSTSLYGEGFSNAIIEAMACLLPVVATEVGEANHQIGDTGKVLVPGNAHELFLVLNEWICNKSFIELGLKARKRVEENFSSLIMAKNTEKFIKEILKD